MENHGASPIVLEVIHGTSHGPCSVHGFSCPSVVDQFQGSAAPMPRVSLKVDGGSLSSIPMCISWIRIVPMNQMGTINRWYSPFSGTRKSLGDIPYGNSWHIRLDHQMSPPCFPRFQWLMGGGSHCWCKNVEYICLLLKLAQDSRNLQCQDVKLSSPCKPGWWFGTCFNFH